MCGICGVIDQKEGVLPESVLQAMTRTLRHRGPDVVPFPDLSQAATYNDAAALLEAAGYDPTLTFGDAEGAVQEVQIGDATPAPGELYRRGTTVFIKALTLD